VDYVSSDDEDEPYSACTLFKQLKLTTDDSHKRPRKSGKRVRGPVPSGSAKKQKTQKKYKSPVRYNTTDAFQHGGLGQVVAVAGDPDVVWRTVPGFPEDRVRASDDGRVWTRDMKGVEKTTRGSINKGNQRAMIGIDGRPYALYHLVCRAFHGGCEGRTADHGQNGTFKERPDDDVVPDCTDNRALNLRWATKRQQVENQKKPKPQRTGKPIWVRHLRRLDHSTWEWFPSMGAAKKATGADSLHKVANDNKKQTHSSGWIAKWADAPETQENLPGERWVEAIGSHGRVWVSNMGRAWLMITNSKTKWGYKFTPKINGGHVYASIGINGVDTLFHRVVWFSFGGTLAPGQTVDHGIDGKFGNGGDPADNRLCNLRAATESEQSLSQTRRPATERQNDLKHAVYARPLDAPADAPWEWFQSMNEAARQLCARHPGKMFTSGNIRGVCNGIDGRKQHAGYHFRRA
jgi:hypothetical protein